MIYSLYMYTNKINGKRYIGVTSNVARRHHEHINGRGCARAFCLALEKYGVDAFDFKVLAIFDQVDAADYHERAAIIKFHTLAPLGYNLCGGAPGTHYAGLHSDETKKKLSKLGMGNQNSLGHRASDAAKQKMSIAFKNRSITTRQKISLAMRGKQNRLGYHVSDETRAKLSAALMYHVDSPETKAKMSATQKRRLALKKGLQ
jgi:group I intron endonuclease